MYQYEQKRYSLFDALIWISRFPYDLCLVVHIIVNVATNSISWKAYIRIKLKSLLSELIRKSFIVKLLTNSQSMSDGTFRQHFSGVVSECMFLR